MTRNPYGLDGADRGTVLVPAKHPWRHGFAGPHSNRQPLARLIGKYRIALSDVRLAESDTVRTGGDGHACAFLGAVLEDKKLAVRAVDRCIDDMVVL